MEDFDAALEDFRRTAEDVYRQHFADSEFTFAVPRVQLMKPGKRYVKLVRVDEDPKTGELWSHTRSVHSFVELATGDIFKPASYKVPAKHARGSIFDEGNGRDGRDSMTREGCIKYMRDI
jgi:hypothetical protein